MTNQKHYLDLGSTRHQYGISTLVPQTSFHGKASNCVVKRGFRGFPHFVGKLVVASREMSGGLFSQVRIKKQTYL